jgi:hypothetical protein
MEVYKFQVPANPEPYQSRLTFDVTADSPVTAKHKAEELLRANRDEFGDIHVDLSLGLVNGRFTLPLSMQDSCIIGRSAYVEPF